MRLTTRSRNSAPTRTRLGDELEAAHCEIDRLRRERDEAMRERDRAVAALHRASAGGGADPLRDFPGYVVVPRWRPLDYPRILVETEASDEDISRMCCELAAEWSAWGKREPFFSNVAHEKFTLSNIAQSKEEFFQTGSETVAQIEAIARRQGIDLRGYETCFELGCGVGRMTAALTGIADTVYAMDVSADHLRVAREVLANTRARVELRKLDGLSSIEALPRFDLFVSFSVLQHNPPPLAAKLLDRSLAKVRVGGVACFQCQTYQTGYRFEVAEYLGRRRGQVGASRGWEMHCLPQPVIYEAFRRNGFALVEVRENAELATGISQVFFALREADDRHAFGSAGRPGRKRL